MKYANLLCGVACTFLALSGVAAQPQPAGRGAAGAAPVETPPVSEEYLLLGDATRGSGEPMIAVDPTNPKNIVVIGMGNLYQTPRDTPYSTIPLLAVTHDGGTIWKIGQLPILHDDLVRCPDPM